jgi:cytochrome b subunit of formate dehydrogenase
MTLNERVQHWVLMASFTTLTITGIPLLAPESDFAKFILMLCGGVGGRALVHRVAGAVMCAGGLYHLVYLVVAKRGRRWLLDMLPSRRDIASVFGIVKYLLGFSDEPPVFGRFGIPEKMEYLGVIWGTFVMGITGFLMAGEDFALRHMPKWAWDGARAVHGWEAVLAVAAIVLWHLYHVLWKPGVWPMSRAWLNGTITFHQLVEEHRGHYDDLVEESGESDANPPPTS